MEMKFIVAIHHPDYSQPCAYVGPFEDMQEARQWAFDRKSRGDVRCTVELLVDPERLSRAEEVTLPFNDNCVICQNETAHTADRPHVFAGQE
jgi:hypothetical protein